MAELGLKKKEVDAIDFAFDVYDFKGDGKVDAFYAGDLIRACNLNPTLKTIAEIGGTTEKGQKMLTKADVFPLYKACKDSKDQGGFHDFVDILKLYDKNDDNTMLSHGAREAGNRGAAQAPPLPARRRRPCSAGGRAWAPRGDVRRAPGRPWALPAWPRQLPRPRRRPVPAVPDR